MVLNNRNLYRKTLKDGALFNILPPMWCGPGAQRSKTLNLSQIFGFPLSFKTLGKLEVNWKKLMT